MSGVDDLIDPRIPIIVFGGPPGTGQTYAVKVIAAKSGRIAYELDVAKLKQNMYEAPHGILQRAGLHRQAAGCMSVHR